MTIDFTAGGIVILIALAVLVIVVTWRVAGELRRGWRHMTRRRRPDESPPPVRDVNG